MVVRAARKQRRRQVAECERHRHNRLGLSHTGSIGAWKRWGTTQLAPHLSLDDARGLTMDNSPTGDWDDSDPPLIYRSWRTVCTVSFLIYAAMGSVLPMLPLFVRTSAGFRWSHTAFVCAALPLGSAIALPLIRWAQRRRYDPRLGTALGQLLCSAMAMSVVMSSQNKWLFGIDWRAAAGLAVLYGVLVAWTASWLHQLAEQTAPANPHASREWRLWGAVGFVLPAWCVELAVGRITSVAWDQFEVLYSISAWIGIAAVAILVVAWQQEVSVRIDEPTSPSHRAVTATSWLLLGAVMLIAVLQRCHDFWVVPFIDRVLEQHQLPSPLSLRLSVVVHVAEVGMLYGLGRLLQVVGLRGGLVLALLVWVGRCAMLGVVAQTPLTARNALTALFVAQVLGGIATVLFFGSAAAVIGRELPSKRGGLGMVVMASGVAAAMGVCVAGAMTEVALDQVGDEWAQSCWKMLPLRIMLGGQLLILREWSGLWFISGVLPLMALPLALAGGGRKSQTD